MSVKNNIKLKTRIAASLLAVPAFILFQSVSHYLLVGARDVNIVMALRVEEPMTLHVGYNFLPYMNQTNYMPVEVKETGVQQVRVRMFHDRVVKQVNMSCEPRFASFILDSLYVENTYFHHSMKGDRLFESVHPSEYSKSDPKAITQNDDGSIQVNFGKDMALLTVDRNFSDPIYKKMNKVPDYVAILGALLVFLILHFLLPRLDFMQQATTLQLSFILIFLILLITPFISRKDYETQENRSMAEFPDFDQLIWHIPGKITAWYNDHFPYRNAISKLNLRIYLKLFGLSPIPDKVGIGDDRWLYNETPELREHYSGQILFTPQELEKIRVNMEEKRDWLKKQGIDFYFFLPPMKHDVYAEYLPENMPKRLELNKRVQLIEHLTKFSDIKLVNPYGILRRAKDSTKVYYKTDTHWNRTGAFLAYEQLMERIHKDHPEIQVYHQNHFEVYAKPPDSRGDITAMLNIDTFFYRDPIVFKPKFESYSVEYVNTDKLPIEQGYLYYKNPKAPATRLLIFRDSFGTYLAPFLSEHFSYTGLSWTTRVLPERVQIDKPDIVVQEMMQVFINVLLDDNPDVIQRGIPVVEETP